jgi:PhnB protein
MATAIAAKPIPAVTGVTPYVMVADAAAAAELYGKAFGAEELVRAPGPDGKTLVHVHLRINGGPVFLADPCGELAGATPSAFNLHLQVDDADRWAARAVAAGLEVVMPVQPMFWGDRYGQLRDRFGVTWGIASPNR